MKKNKYSLYSKDLGIELNNISKNKLPRVLADVFSKSPDFLCLSLPSGINFIFDTSLINCNSMIYDQLVIGFISCILDTHERDKYKHFLRGEK